MLGQARISLSYPMGYSIDNLAQRNIHEHYSFQTTVPEKPGRVGAQLSGVSSYVRAQSAWQPTLEFRARDPYTADSGCVGT